MQASILIGVYILTTIFVQAVGFLVSRAVDLLYPTFGLIAFLILFLAAFGIAWPIAVRLAEWLIGRMGYVVDTRDPRAT